MKSGVSLVVDSLVLLEILRLSNALGVRYCSGEEDQSLIVVSVEFHEG